MKFNESCDNKLNRSSSNFNESNEENLIYLFQFNEQGKRDKRTAHNFFVDLTSPKKGKTWRFCNLRVRKGPKKESTHTIIIGVLRAQ